MYDPNLTYDFIVTGFGCAGMSFVYHLLDSSLKDANILVIDPSDKSVNDRTWCYWAETPLDIHPKKTPLIFWENISIRKGQKEVIKTLENLKYYHIKSSDFYAEIKERVKNFPNVHFTLDAIISMEENSSGGVSVTTSENGIFNGKKVFNSIPDKKILKKDNKILKQVFVGWKIKTQDSCFEKNTVTLMDFLKDRHKITDFFYILPYSEKEALVEYTVFTTNNLDFKKMEASIHHFITNNLGQENFEITFKEEGTIPMTTQSPQESNSVHIIHLGTLAGCSKPSTGYTFYTIQKHCKSIIKSLETKKAKKNAVWARKVRFNFYDNIILNIAKKWPDALPGVFLNLFETNSGPTVLRFLNEETKFLQELKLLLRLKFPIFIKSLFYYEKH
jgi:lycopene beta-cyclase